VREESERHASCSRSLSSTGEADEADDDEVEEVAVAVVAVTENGASMTTRGVVRNS
jgi:hypothetical protein